MEILIIKPNQTQGIQFGSVRKSKITIIHYNYNNSNETKYLITQFKTKKIFCKFLDEHS